MPALKNEELYGLLHTCTKYGYMKAHTKAVHDYKDLFTINMNYGGLANIRLGKSCHKGNMHHHTYHFANNT